MRVGFIGLGTMGAAMATNLVARGHELVVHDVRAEAADDLVVAGAAWAATPRDVASEAEVVLTSLPGPTEVHEVVAGPDGVLAGSAPGCVHLDLSTNSWAGVRRLADHYAEHRSWFLDAPVSGGPAGARSRRLAVWVGGDPDAFDRVRPILEDLADRVARVGDVGAGTVVKLVHNATGNTVNLVLAELFTVADAAGVDPAAVWQHVRQGAVGRRRTFDGLAAHFLPQAYDPPALSLALARKDMGLLLELADEVGIDVPRARGTTSQMDAAIDRGWGARDSRVTMLLEQDRRGHHLDPVPEERLAEVLAADPPAAADVHRDPDPDQR